MGLLYFIFLPFYSTNTFSVWRRIACSSHIKRPHYEKPSNYTARPSTLVIKSYQVQQVGRVRQENQESISIDVNFIDFTDIWQFDTVIQKCRKRWSLGCVNFASCNSFESILIPSSKQTPPRKSAMLLLCGWSGEHKL